MTNDGDVAHLLDLLDLLPPAEDDDDRALGMDQLSLWTRQVRELPDPHGTAEAPLRLAAWCLQIFGSDPEATARQIEDLIPGVGGRADVGRRWVDDMQATAWRVWVARKAGERRRMYGPFGAPFDED